MRKRNIRRDESTYVYFGYTGRYCDIKLTIFLDKEGLITDEYKFTLRTSHYRNTIGLTSAQVAAYQGELTVPNQWTEMLGMTEPKRSFEEMFYYELSEDNYDELEKRIIEPILGQTADSELVMNGAPNVMKFFEYIEEHTFSDLIAQDKADMEAGKVPEGKTATSVPDFLKVVKPDKETIN